MRQSAHQRPPSSLLSKQSWMQWDPAIEDPPGTSQSECGSRDIKVFELQEVLDFIHARGEPDYSNLGGL